VLLSAMVAIPLAVEKRNGKSPALCPSATCKVAPTLPLV
jgi:hypothetical protein